MSPSGVCAGDVTSASFSPLDTRSVAFVYWSTQSAHSALTAKGLTTTQTHSSLSIVGHSLPHCSLTILINLQQAFATPLVFPFLLALERPLLVSSCWLGGKMQKRQKTKPKERLKQRWLMNWRFVEASRSQLANTLQSTGSYSVVQLKTLSKVKWSNFSVRQ